MKFCAFACVTTLFFSACSLGPMDTAQLAMQSDGQVTVVTSPWYTFSPVSPVSQTGLIFYPGGLVKPESYAPMMHALAASGYLTVIAPMPFDLAVFDSEEAARVMAANPSVKKWVLSGHSLGAAMACAFAKKHPGEISGLALMAGYPAEGDSLAEFGWPVLSFWATHDGLATKAKVDSFKYLLPASTEYFEVVGGNHAGYGYYGVQNGDGTNTISRDEQQRIVREKLLLFLSAIR